MLNTHTPPSTDRVITGSAGNALDDLLSPFPVDRFLQEHWSRQGLYIHGDPAKFARFPDLERLPALLAGRLCSTRWSSGHAHNAQASVIDRTGHVRWISAPPSTWPDLFNAGASLCFSAVDHCHEELRRFVHGIAATTRLPGKISTTCYLTPAHSGSGMHFDAQHVFFMQVAGRKHWTFAQQAAWQDAPANIQVSGVASPEVNGFLQAIGVTLKGPEETGLREATLNAGDVLYLPPGFWHDGRTSDSHSLHYTLTFMPVDPWHLFVAYLKRRVFASATLRRDLRFVRESGAEDVRDVVEDALDELRETVNALRAQDLEDFYREMSASNSPLRRHFLGV